MYRVLCDCAQSESQTRKRNHQRLSLKPQTTKDFNEQKFRTCRYFVQVLQHRKVVLILIYSTIIVNLLIVTIATQTQQLNQGCCFDEVFATGESRKHSEMYHWKFAQSELYVSNSNDRIYME